MWHFSKAFGSENYRLAVSRGKHLATVFATSSNTYAVMPSDFRYSCGYLLLYFSTSVLHVLCCDFMYFSFFSYCCRLAQ